MILTKPNEGVTGATSRFEVLSNWFVIRFMGQEVILGLHDGSILIIQFRYLKSEVRVNEMKQKASKYPLQISG